jgi:predicted permease
MPDNMNFPINAELWIPLIPSPAQEQRDSRSLGVFGRLTDGATVRDARGELNGIAQRQAAAYPATNRDLALGRVETITDRFVGGQARVMFPVVMGATGFVLLIACANVANLLLSRSLNRAREMAMRLALGASRWRILRQLLLESIVLACISGAIGVWLALAGAHAINGAVTDPGKPYWIVFTMDYTVLAYLAGICLLTGILFGLAPAFHASKGNINEVMKQAVRTTAGGRTRWFSGTMVVVELALTVVLLVGAGLMTRSFLKLFDLDIGFRTENVMAMRLQLPNTRYATAEARRAFYEQLEPRLAGIPGVQAVALTTSVPPFGGSNFQFEIEGRTRASGGPAPSAVMPLISVRFFDVLDVAPRRGRVFSERDGAPGAEAAIINERVASTFFPGEDPVGRRLRFMNPDSPWCTIVGVVPSIRHGTLDDPEAPLAIYVPSRQVPPAGPSLLIRSALPPASVLEAVRREVQKIDQDQPVFTIATMDEMLAQNRWAIRLFGGLFIVFAVIALVMSAVGVYAVMSYAVAQRTQEIGVRMALGAGTRQVSWLVLKRGMMQLTIGLTIGLLGALALSRVMRRLLVQVTPTDPVTFIAVAVLMAAVAITACLLPARRATRIDPLIAIRAE